MQTTNNEVKVNIDGKIDAIPFSSVMAFPAVKTDAELAQELRDEMAPYLAGLCKALDKARANGLRTEFNLVPDAFGRHNPPYVTITKSL